MTPRPTKKLAITIAAMSATVLIGIVAMTSVRKPASNNQAQSSSTTSSQAISDEQQNNNSNIGNTTTDRSKIIYDDIAHSTDSVITNYDAIVKNLPNSRKQDANRMLLYTLLANSVSTKPTDATIRQDTYSQQIVDANRSIYRTTYIIDIPSLKQSYRVTDDYSPIPNNNPPDYTTTVTCLDGNDIIYPNFHCIDQFNQNQGGL